MKPQKSKVIRKTPVTDMLARLGKPPMATDEQWMDYLESVRKNEESGETNPTFGMPTPWTKLSTSRKLETIYGK